MSAERNETEAVIEHELRVAASPDSVFDYFIDPAKMGQRCCSRRHPNPRSWRCR